MKAVILCGGKGFRLREETEVRPKPMLLIGDRPILWHIMKIYSCHGHREFILCLGYKGEIIKEYFRNYLWMTSDVTMSLGATPSIRFHDEHGESSWVVTMAETGMETLTGGRIKRIQKYIGEDEHFLLTYGDGVGNVDVNAVVAHHKKEGRILTVTAVRPPGRFGEIAMDERQIVREFNEKPQAEGGWINGGFFVASRRVFDYLTPDEGLFEQEPMKRLAKEGQISAYLHRGFWFPMDTAREHAILSEMWRENRAPWRIW